MSRLDAAAVETARLNLPGRKITAHVRDWFEDANGEYCYSAVDVYAA